MAGFQYWRYQDTSDSSIEYDSSSFVTGGKELSGVYDDMIRISVGIEDIEDLKEDFKRVIEGDDENGKS